MSFLLLLLHWLVFLLLRPSSASLPPDATALLSVKSGFSNSSALSNWEPSTFHCTWRGVYCDSLHRVTALDISGLGLSGTLSPSIADLTSLLNLTAASNSLTGAIPASLSLLSSLRHLNLSNNIFNATFPPSLRSLTDLSVLDLYNNNLTGNLPAPLPPNLLHLHLGGNFFSGAIPPEYGQCHSLQYLALSGNALTGPIPKELGNLTNLDHLYLGYFNSYAGGIPPEFGNLTKLIRLDIASSGLSGRIPPELGKLENLDTLFLQVNALSGLIPMELGKLRNIQSMDLSNNGLTGVIPPSFSQLRSLSLLNLFRNNLYGTIPDFFGDMTELEVLQLWDNRFTGSIPPRLGLRGRLQFLDLSTNNLTGSLPPELCSGGKLEALILLGNSLRGEIPPGLGRCLSLRRIRLGENYLDGSIPLGLFSLPMLVQLELQDNLLSGEFPDTGNSVISQDLGQLSLSNNRLTGQLPPSIGNFSGVQKLLLKQNLFSGSIPPEIGQLHQLSQLDFSHNQLSGPIPPDIGKCKLMTYVDLSSNNLSDGIPEEITGLPILNYLNLSRNDLSGEIPASIGTMQSLTSADLSYNNLSGYVPGTGQFSYYNATSFAGNPGLCGPYIAPCHSSPPAGRDPLSATAKLLLVTGLLILSMAFAAAAVIKAQHMKKASDARAWRLTAFRRLDFTCDDVLDCIKDENIIGKGGAGVVYKGTMPNGELVAIKQLSKVTRGITYHDHGFSAEVQTLGKIRHRHIVRLLGFCANRETNLLVYEYMSNGSLGEVLHGKMGGHLVWETRYRIAVEAAKGMCYLHHDCSPLIVHRDVKSNNILLDANLEAHVADFGLAKFLQDSGDSECMSAVAGSYGYIAPEYAYTLRVDEKSDVYSFGVVLLELVTGRKPVGEFGDGVDIVNWVWEITGGKKEGVVDILDKRLPMVPIQEVMHVFYVAMMCVAELSVERPTMREVVQILSEQPKLKSEESSGETNVFVVQEEVLHQHSEQPPPPSPHLLNI